MRPPIACLPASFHPRHLLRIGLVAGLLGLVGCGTGGQDYTAGLREVVQGPEFRTEVLPAREQAAVHAAAVTALERMGFRVTRAGAARGIVEGVSRLHSDDHHAGSRQRAVYVRVRQNLDDVRVEVRFTEIVEDSFAKGPGRATETTLRDTPLHEVFRRNLDQALAEGAAPP
jgi:hypothetical protein